MNLIEQLGGYEEAKKIKVAFDATHYCISRKSQMKMFSVGAIGSATIAHSIACGLKETKLEDDDLVTQKQIDRALLEYRRQHNIYEAGDLVVMVDEDDYDTIFKVIGKPQRLYHLQGDDDLFYGRLDFQIRHATDEEIKSGDRIEQEAKS